MKKKKKTKRRNLLNLPKGNNYFWKILAALVRDAKKDAAKNPDWTELPVTFDELQQIIRERSVQKYVEFCERWSLTELNARFSDTLTEQSVREIRWIYLLTLGKKFDFAESPFDQLDAALSTFKKFEAQCKETNGDELFRTFWTEDSTCFIEDEFYVPVLRSASTFIRNVLGDEPMLDELLNAVHHGPGATSEKSGNEAVAILKHAPPIGVTSQARDFLEGAILSDQRWMRSLMDFHKRVNADFDASLLEQQLTPLDVLSGAIQPVEQSRILFVPKNSKTLRTIAAEPTGNVYCQLALNSVIRRRLKRFGIDLTTQVKNQELALRGSLLGDLVTIDLSGASDTIALTWLNLFPWKWAGLLLDLRCHIGLNTKTNEVINFEKLCSMGNGYTFCIETLIFAALIHGVLEYRGMDWEETLPSIAVYGDDIIVPKAVYFDLARVLKRVGFTMNLEKSFTYGPVRESCGDDFFNGQRISRPTLKSRPSQAWEVIRDHNLLYLLSRDYGLGLTDTLSTLENWIPLKYYGPLEREDLTCWIFCDKPKGAYRLIKQPQVFPVKSKGEQLAADLQTDLYILKRNRLTLRVDESYPALKHLVEICFEPLMFLTYDSNPVMSEIKIANQTLKISNQPGEPSYWYDKMALKCKTSTVYIESRRWCDPPFAWPNLLPAR